MLPRLTKRTKCLIFNELLNEIRHSSGYITKIEAFSDKEFLTFNVNSGVVLIGHGFMSYTDEDALKISYPKARDFTEEDIKNYLGDAYIFKNNADTISVRFHVTDKADYYITILLDVISVVKRLYVDIEDIYFDTKEELENLNNIK